MCNIFLQGAYPAEVFQQIWQGLSEEQRQALQTPTAHVFRPPTAGGVQEQPSNSHHH